MITAVTGNMIGLLLCSVLSEEGIYVYKVRFFDLEDLYDMLKIYYEKPENEALKEFKNKFDWDVKINDLTEFHIEGIELKMERDGKSFGMMFNNPLSIAVFEEEENQ